jgi:hypothetical protein
MMWNNTVKLERLQVTAHTACQILKATNPEDMQLLLFHGNNGCMIMPHVIRTMSVLFLDKVDFSLDFI